MPLPRSDRVPAGRGPSAPRVPAIACEPIPLRSGRFARAADGIRTTIGLGAPPVFPVGTPYGRSLPSERTSASRRATARSISSGSTMTRAGSGGSGASS